MQLSMIISRYIYVAPKGIISLFFMSEYYCIIYITSPSSIQIIRLLPCLGYCKQCCNEHWSTYIFSNNGFLWIYAQE